VKGQAPVSAALALRRRVGDTHAMNAETRDLPEGASFALTVIGAYGRLRWSRLAGTVCTLKAV
jgi:hypothetical protein